MDKYELRVHRDGELVVMAQYSGTEEAMIHRFGELLVSTKYMMGDDLPGTTVDLSRSNGDVIASHTFA